MEFHELTFSTGIVCLKGLELGSKYTGHVNPIIVVKLCPFRKINQHSEHAGIGSAIMKPNRNTK
jgi:hypothetical protein